MSRWSTGASRGIGRAIALELAAAGAAVGVNYRADGDAAAEVVAAIEQAGGRAAALQADVSDADAAKALVETCESRLGELDVLVCNAGVTRDGLIARLSAGGVDDRDRHEPRGPVLPLPGGEPSHAAPPQRLDRPDELRRRRARERGTDELRRPRRPD